MSERSIWNARDSIDYLQQKTVGRKSTHDCAKFVREAIEAGGVKLNKHHSAKNYKASLITAGFLSLGSAAGRYLPGDIIIIESSPGHPHGHIALYDGTKWISDFPQRNMLHMYPEQSARQSGMLNYTIYRYGIRWDSIVGPRHSDLA